ncbi:MAG: TetR/AcrR family transcriptional regulator [Leptospiraceae bacterium]|nr:TetR/AcrR family transcriptional regulator [Leptospiraceae bacterium]
MPRVKEFDKEEVLRKAMELFWKQGYHATSMQDLVDHLGINRASLYDTFGGKKALFDLALQNYRNVYFSAMEQTLENYPVREALQKMFAGAVEAASQDKHRKGCFVVNSTTELAASDEDIREAVDQNKQQFETLLARHIRIAQKEGRIESKKNPAQLAALIFAFYNGFQVLARIKPDKKELQNLVRTAISILDS